MKSRSGRLGAGGAGGSGRVVGAQLGGAGGAGGRGMDGASTGQLIGGKLTGTSLSSGNWFMDIIKKPIHYIYKYQISIFKYVRNVNNVYFCLFLD